VYAVRAQHRDALKEALHDNGVDAGIHYPFPVHLVKAHADLGYKEGDFPEAERAAKETLSLPLFAELTEDQVRTVCDAVRKEAERK
jgi:dTDP-4-amino-4,6-dideoxygalactose transaminase